MSNELSSRQRRGKDRAFPFQWYQPKGRRPSVYEDVTMDVVAAAERHWKFGYNIAFPDGRSSYWEGTTLQSTSWWDYRDPGQLWGRQFYELGAVADRQIKEALEVAKADKLYAQFESAWVNLLRNNLQAIALTEYGLTMPMAHAMRPARGDAIANAIGFQGGFKLRHAQALALYGMHLEELLGDFPATRGKQTFLQNPAWQPVRRYLERLETIHDWGETVVAANVLFEPLVGVLLRRDLLMHTASSHGDVVSPVYGRVGQAEWAWGRAWTVELMSFLVEDAQFGESNREILDAWLADWRPMAQEAMEALKPVFDEVSDSAFDSSRARVEQDLTDMLVEGGLEKARTEVPA
jgi:propane monooxygenase small subunit